MNKFILLIAALQLLGCASIVSRSAYPVLIVSTPADAEFVITNRNGIEVKRGQTPATVWLESGEGYFVGGYYTVYFNKPGYKPQNHLLVSRINEWYWSNIFFPPGLLVDPATGAMWRLPLRLDAGLVEKTAIVSSPK